MALDALRDGFIRLCFDPSLNVLGANCRLVLEGQFLATGSAIVNTLVKVTSTRDIDLMFGVGSVLSESLKVAIDCCGNDSVEIFALPRPDPLVGVAAVYTLTVIGPATSDGRVDLYMGEGRYNISVPVDAGNTATQIAAAIVLAISPTFPFIATNALGVVTLTARNTGVVGNRLVVEYNWHGRNNYTPEGVTATVAQTIVGSGAMLASDYSTVFGDCCVCCLAVLTQDTVVQNAAISYLEEAWSCDKPQCFGHGYTYNSGTLGQILATDTNSATISRLAHCIGDPVLPYLKVAAYSSKSCCTTQDNPEISIQGPNFGVLDCLSQPESCAACLTFDEQNQLRDSGFVITVPVAGGQGRLTSPMITNDITNNRFDAEGRENLTFQDVSARRLATATATAIAEQLQQFNGLGYYTDGTNIREGAKGVNRRMMLGTMRAWARSQVGLIFSEFDDLNADLTFVDDFQIAPRCQGVPGKVYMNLIYRPPVRIKQIVVNARPKLLNNC